MTLKVKAVRVSELEPGHSASHTQGPSYCAVSSLRGKRACVHTHTQTDRQTHTEHPHPHHLSYCVARARTHTHITPDPHHPSYCTVSSLRGKRVCVCVQTHTQHTSPTTPSEDMDMAGTRPPSRSLRGKHVCVHTHTHTHTHVPDPPATR